MTGLMLATGLALGQPSRTAQRPPLEAIYRGLDTNRDGNLSPEEFAGVSRFSPRLKDKPEQVETAFQQMDVNTDGRISLDEFRKFGEGMSRLPAQRGGSPAAQMQQRLETGFQTLDANRDRKLDRKEFERIGQFAKQLEGDSVAAQYLFSELDKNQDGSLTQEEFKGLAALAAQYQPVAPKTKSPSSAAAPTRPPTPEQLAFFEKQIRPVLVDKCYQCHSAEAEKIKGSLVLDTREGIRKGGDTGPAVVPGNLPASLLIKAIRYADSDLAMPPKKQGGKLPDNVIADFEKWVSMGAPDPRDGKALVAKKSWDSEKGKDHWAFKLPVKAPPPQVKDTAWACNDVDRYVLAELEANGLKPVGDADRRTLIRRVHFDLIGLPPTPEQVEAFINDPSPGAFEKVVDGLLGKPQFGERWGRHWLDVARYAESSGKENNIIYPHAWRYRDYVIKAFADDKPYDQFLREQIAGDLLPAKDQTQKAWQQIATGFLAIGPKSHNTRDPRQFALDLADEQIDAVSQGMLGLTVSCARCHDHKFDPIPQAEYYAMAGIFLSTETRFGTPRFIQNNQATPLLTLSDKANLRDAPPMPPRQIGVLKHQLEQARKERDEVLAESKGSRDRAVFANPKLIRSATQVAILEKQLDRYDVYGRPLRLAMGVQERMFPRDTQLLARGEPDKPLDTVPRGFVQIVNTKSPSQITQGSGRLELAEWIASPENPLTARVMANRVWLQLFGTGIVATPDNFGAMGQKPTNQPLLDHLAMSFVENGWSVKKLIRQIVLSHTYQLSSDHSAANFAIDPDNVHHWRMSKRRLDAECIRDAMLAVSGKLDLHQPNGSPVANSEGPVLALLRFGALNSERPVRSVYLPIVRDQAPEALAVFDFAEASLVVGDREVTTVPSQALYLMNSVFVQRTAEAMAERLLAQNLRDTDLANAAFQLAFGRSPSTGELQATQLFFETFKVAEATRFQSKESLGKTGLVAFCQGLLGSAEFRYLN